jgi:hypothetical protein
MSDPVSVQVIDRIFEWIFGIVLFLVWTDAFDRK